MRGWTRAPHAVQRSVPAGSIAPHLGQKSTCPAAGCRGSGTSPHPGDRAQVFCSPQCVQVCYREPRYRRLPAVGVGTSPARVAARAPCMPKRRRERCQHGNVQVDVVHEQVVNHAVGRKVNPCAQQAQSQATLPACRRHNCPHRVIDKPPSPHPIGSQAK